MKVGVVHRWWYLDHARPSARQQKKAYQRDERAPSAAYHRSGSEERRPSEGRRAHTTWSHFSSSHRCPLCESQWRFSPSRPPLRHSGLWGVHIGSGQGGWRGDEAYYGNQVGI